MNETGARRMPRVLPRRSAMAGLAACALARPAAAANSRRIGARNGPEAELLSWLLGQDSVQGLGLELVVAADAASLAEATAAGRLAGFAGFTGQELDRWNAAHRGSLALGFPTVTLPLCIYSRRRFSVAQLRDGDTIVLPSTRLDYDRARVLMYNYRLLFAHEDAGLDADFGNVVNPRHFVLKQEKPERLAGHLDHDAAVVMPYDVAEASGLRAVADAIGREDGKSPYAQTFVVPASLRHEDWLGALALAFQSRETRRFIYDHYGDSIEPPW
jgi:D-methionine transport system substrate-binding protein